VLASPKTTPFESGLDYSLVYPEQDALPRELMVFRDWVLEQSRS
jgi:hypothetical protein